MSTSTPVLPVQVPIADGGGALDGDLAVPEGARAVVAFAHGSGSSRHSPRNRAVAETLQQAGFATLLVDLLTPEEEAVDLRTRELRFDLSLLAARLGDVLAWLPGEASLGPAGAAPVGLFGASTGGGAALIAAAHHPERVGAVVSRGGRPDLAGKALRQVRCPVLLLVGGRDEPVLELNEQAAAELEAPTELRVISGATHLFTEPNTLDEVARQAADWFRRHLSA